MSGAEITAGRIGGLSGARLARRDVLLGGLCAATAGITLWRMPRTPLVALPASAKIDDVLPMRVGGWQQGADMSMVLPPEDEALAASTYDQQVARSYANGVDSPVMMLVAYARLQTGMLQVHRPESCYPAAGFALSPMTPETTRLSPTLAIDSSAVTATRDDRIERILYWTRFGTMFPRTWHEQRGAMRWLNLQGWVPDGVLVRLSTIEPDAARADALLQRFAAALYAAAGAPGRALLAGPEAR